MVKIKKNSKSEKITACFYNKKQTALHLNQIKSDKNVMGLHTTILIFDLNSMHLFQLDNQSVHQRLSGFFSKKKNQNKT